MKKTRREEITVEQQWERLTQAQAQARQAWQRLWMRLQCITPGGLVRFLLLMGSLIAITWLVVMSLPSLVTLMIGIALAYIVLPIVNFLNYVMPRSLAVLVVILAELALIVLFFLLLIPVLVNETTRLLSSLPDPRQIHDIFTSLLQQIRTWPSPIRDFLRGVGEDAVANARQNFIGYVQYLLGFALRGILRLLSSFAFLLSLLVIPTWIFSILKDQRKGQKALDRILPDWLRGDFWAVIRIIERTLGVYLREVVLVAVLVGLATYGGLWLLEDLGVQGIQIPLLLAIIAGFTDIIPSIGTILGTVPAVVFTAIASSWEAGLFVLALYIVIHLLRNWLLAPLFTRSITLHPAILIVILLIASQFGPLWLFIAAPLAVIGRDLFSYTYRRLGDPPSPVGLLPGDPPPRQPARRTQAPRPFIPLETGQSENKQKTLSSMHEQ